jgi:ABC-type Na+ efflux pump permease subunit
MERQSLTELFLFPVEPQRILWGKNLTVFVMGLVELVVLVLAASFLSHAWNFTLPTLAVGLAGIGVTLGCGNFTSVFFPQRMRQMQRGFRATGASSGNGCLRGIMSLIMLIVTAIVLTPLILAFILPLLFHAEWVWVFVIPVALLYGIAFHQTVSRLVALRMLAREPEILALTTRE